VLQILKKIGGFMSLNKVLFLIFMLVVVVALPLSASAKKKSQPKVRSTCPAAEVGGTNACSPTDTEGDEEVYDTDEFELEESDISYQRMYYTFGVAGSYFVKKDSIGIDGFVGAYTNLEYRILKILSIGFDTLYGWAFGNGNQYLSAFNPGVKIYPMQFKNPNFEPFIMIGGHAFDGLWGARGYSGYAMGQGGYAGVGARYMPAGGIIGVEFFTRASFLYMQKPSTAGGGRGLAIPILAFVGVVY